MIIINKKVFIKREILSVETILSAYTHTHAHTQTHRHTDTDTDTDTDTHTHTHTHGIHILASITLLY